MIERELLQLAALAAGIPGRYVDYQIPCSPQDIRVFGICEPSAYAPIAGQHVWNPLIDDGDAFRLAVRLNLDIEIGRRDIEASWSEPDGSYYGVKEPGEKSAGNPLESTRRAIVRAAAEIGQVMQAALEHDRLMEGHHQPPDEGSKSDQ